MKKIFSILSLCVICFSYEIKLNSNLTAICKYNNNLFIGTNSGDVFILSNKKLNKIISLGKIENYYSYNETSTIYNIDALNNDLLIVSEGNFGNKDLILYKNKILKKYDFKIDDTLKAFFVDENTILLLTIGCEIKLVDIKNNKILKDFKLNESTLKDAVLNKNKDKIAIGFESGELFVFDIKKWKIENKFNLHKDNIYQVDFKNSKIITCSTDKNINIIDNKKIKTIKENFLIYSCALNDKANLAAYADNEKSTINVVNLEDLKIIKTFKNDFSTEFILFLNDEIVNAGYENKIVFWSLK